MSTKGFPFRVIPTGWFQVGWSDELIAGETVTPMHYFGQDLVMYRTAAGKVVVLDAHCLHQGAHLGYGGRVQGEEIVCPYHGWQWSPDGQNTFIPYSDQRVPQKMRVWPVQEMAGLIMVWHHPTGAPPSWELPDIPEDGDSTYHGAAPQSRQHWAGLKMPAQLVSENAVDGVHFKYVHGNSDMGVAESFSAEAEVFHAVCKLTFGGGREKTWLTPNGPVQGTQEFTVHGLGLFLTRFLDTDLALQVDCATPIDCDSSDRRVTLFVKREAGSDSTVPTGNGARRVRASLMLAAQDFPIWENQVYRTPPLLVREEAKPQIAIRKWARQFYEGLAS